MGENRYFKCGVQVDHSKSQPTDDKMSLKGRGNVMTRFTAIAPFIHLSIRLFVTRWYCIKIKTAKYRNTQATPHDSPVTLVLYGAKDLGEIRQEPLPVGWWNVLYRVKLLIKKAKAEGEDP